MPVWLSCTFDRTCVCVNNFKNLLRCSGSKPYRYGHCHRYEQSSLGIILSKLLLDRRPMVYLPSGSVRVARSESHDWFLPIKQPAIHVAQKARHE